MAGKKKNDKRVVKREHERRGNENEPGIKPEEGAPQDRVEELTETTFSDESEAHRFSNETSMDFVSEKAEVSDEAVMGEIARYTDDPDVLEDFAERQMLDNGSEGLWERLTRHNSKSPDLSADDIDAAWEDSDVSGEESVGGTTPTPDQDIVEEIGEAMGIEYNDDEPLNTYDKLDRRDKDRYELDVQSMLDMAGELVPPEDTPYGEVIEELRALAALEGAEVDEDLSILANTGDRRGYSPEDDSLHEDIDALGDTAFPQKTSDEKDDAEDL